MQWDLKITDTTIIGILLRQSETILTGDRSYDMLQKKTLLGKALPVGLTATGDNNLRISLEITYKKKAYQLSYNFAVSKQNVQKKIDDGNNIRKTWLRSYRQGKLHCLREHKEFLCETQRDKIGTMTDRATQ